MNLAAPPGPTLRREMSGTDGLLVTLAGLSPSLGVFVVGSDVIRMAGSGAVLCFLAAAVLGVAMASVYAELGSSMPGAGGEYTIAGRLLGPDAGFAMLSVNLCGLCLATSLSSLGVAGYLQAVLPGLPTIPTALGLVVAVTGLAVLSIRVNALVTGVLLGCEMASLAVTAWLGFAHVQPGAAARLLHLVMAGPNGVLHAVPLAVLGVGAAGGIYAFNGYGSVIFFGEEIRDARRNVAAIVYGSLAIAAVTELAPMAGVVVGAPDLAELAAAPAPIAQFIGQAGGAVLARVMSLAVAAALFNTMIAIMLSAARQLYASARDNAWPAGGRHLAALHPRFGSPYVATLVVGGAALACCLLPASVLVTILANGNIATYATLCLAAIVGRRSGLTADTRARAPLFPLGPVCVLLALAGVIWADLLDPANGVPGLLAMLAIVGLGVGVHRLVVRGNPAWGHRD
jgi:amino acid transporter